jgi:predicted enzyme related to lactoylglutathione lyase
MTSVFGPDFLAIQVRDLQRSAGFYEREFGLQRAAGSPPGVVAFQTSPIPFAVREPLPGTNLDAGPAGLGVSLSLHADDAQALHDQLKSRGVPILVDPFDTPYGPTFVFEDPDGYAIAIHGAPESVGKKDAED